MKLHVLSDIHVEFEEFNAPATDADVVVLAGDIHVGRNGLDWALKQFPDKPVLYVLGNHEYYGKAIPRYTEKLREFASGTRHPHSGTGGTYDRWSDLSGMHGCGLTLSYSATHALRAYEATQKMTDYKKIRVSPKYSRLRSIDTCAIHHRSRRWLETQIQENTDDVVVITHHAPSVKSLPDSKHNDLMSAAYVSNLDDFVSQSGAKFWIHGHLHAPSDYTLGKTRVLCEPERVSRRIQRSIHTGIGGRDLMTWMAAYGRQQPVVASPERTLERPVLRLPAVAPAVSKYRV